MVVLILYTVYFWYKTIFFKLVSLDKLHRSTDLRIISIFVKIYDS
jgi:hypothetical protein